MACRRAAGRGCNAVRFAKLLPKVSHMVIGREVSSGGHTQNGRRQNYRKPVGGSGGIVDGVGAVRKRAVSASDGRENKNQRKLRG